MVNALQGRRALAWQHLKQKGMGEGKTKHLPHRMLFLLHLLLGTILKGPLDNISLMRDTFDVMALVQLFPEVVKVLKLDQMPDLSERGSNDGRLCDGT